MLSRNPEAEGEILKLLSVVIPARDEADCVRATVEHVHLELELNKIPHEIVVVNDGSTDRTWPILQEIAANNPTVRPINNEGLHGFGRAVIKGIDAARGDAMVITMADDSTLRVRLDVDESDVSKLRVGQRAYVTAEAYGTHKFQGRVIRVGRILGKKNVRTDEPSEHVDTKILETLVELDVGQPLPLGLRVDAFVEIGEAQEP